MYSLHYEQVLLIDDEEPSRYLTFIDGTLRKFVGHGEEIPIGTFGVILVDVAAAMNDGESLFAVFDSSARTIDYFNLYAPGCELKPKVLRAMTAQMAFHYGLLILDRLQIDPEHRGMGLGLRVLRWLEHQFSMGCGIVAIKPFPLQFEDRARAQKKDEEEFVRARFDLFDCRLDVATKKLGNYYSRLGFAKVPGTPLMVADPERTRPTLEALGLEL